MNKYDGREILDLSIYAYTNSFPAQLGVPPLFVPDSWREAFGRMWDNADPENPVEIVPTFQEYDSFLRNLGGATQFIKPEGNKFVRCPVAEATRAGMLIPWDLVSPSANITQMKQDLDETLAVYGVKWYSSLLKINEWQTKYPMVSEEI